MPSDESMPPGIRGTKPKTPAAAAPSPPTLESLPIKLLNQIFQYVDLHSLLQCRLLCHSFQDLVDHRLDHPGWLSWNPYFTVRRYFDLNSTLISGFTRLESVAQLQEFVKRHCPKPGAPAKCTGPVKAAPRPAWNSPQGYLSFHRPSKSTPPASKSSVASVTAAALFPRGALHIRRRLQDYPSLSPGPADSHTALLLWTNRLLQHFGSHLTAFTLDTGKRSGSDLLFPQLRTLLLLLPNLQKLGVYAGNYEHPDAAICSTITLFPPLPHLKTVNLGYNTTFHLHMDMVNAYASQLESLSSSRFGYLLALPEMVSTVNSLQKLLDYASTLPPSKKMFASLTSLKMPLTSTEPLPMDIPLPKLRRLSLHYLHIPQAPVECHLEHLLQFLHPLSPKLSELFLDFSDFTSFLQWMPSPVALYPFPQLRKLGISCICLLRPTQMAACLTTAHFPALRHLSFFNWALFQEECGVQENPELYPVKNTPGEIQELVTPFWNNLALETLHVLEATFASEAVYTRISLVNN